MCTTRAHPLDFTAPPSDLNFLSLSSRYTQGVVLSKPWEKRSVVMENSSPCSPHCFTSMLISALSPVPNKGSGMLVLYEKPALIGHDHNASALSDAKAIACSNTSLNQQSSSRQYPLVSLGLLPVIILNKKIVDYERKSDFLRATILRSSFAASQRPLSTYR